MKNILKVSTILSWFNLVVAGLVVVYILLAGLLAGYFLVFLIVMILPGSIVLHSYAALQLRKSILHPEIPLGNQTPIGIRFLGFVVMALALISIYNSISLIRNPDELIKQVKQLPEAASLDIAKLLRIGTAFSVIFSTSIIANALINFRLLKCYMMETGE